MDIKNFTQEKLSKLSEKDLKNAISKVLEAKNEARKECQILYYQSASKDAKQIHLSHASTIGVGGGNRSSKTESCLVESIALATGVFPLDYYQVFKEKFRGPINVRICIESLTTVLHPILLPKLMWWRWVGPDRPGGRLGHYGWVPRMCLKDGEWGKSWSEKLRVLTILCRDPDNLDEILGESTIQILSYDQDPKDYASGTFHIVHMDEPPPYPIWQENQARVMDVGGRILLSMTWPNDPSVGVDWIYDEVYERGVHGPLKDPDIDWFVLQTVENVHIDQKAIAEKSRNWDDQTKKVKLQGQPLRFSNRIHPLFTDLRQTWCFGCGRNCIPDGKYCGCERKATDLCEYSHVEEFEIGESWPIVYLLDPHPRKPHMMVWVAIDPSDDYYIVEEAEIEGDAEELKHMVDEIEESREYNIKLRLMDPNMGRSPSGARREITWQDEFENVGLNIELADSSEVGRKRVNQYLKPDFHTHRPRIVFHPRCLNASLQMKRYVWGDYRQSLDRDVKQSPKPKYDDYPTMFKYLLNYLPTFSMLYTSPPVIQRPGQRKGAY